MEVCLLRGEGVGVMECIRGQGHKTSTFASSTCTCLVSLPFLKNVLFPLDEGKGSKRQVVPFLLLEMHPFLWAPTAGFHANQAEAFRNAYLLPWRSQAGKVWWFLEIRL